MGMRNGDEDDGVAGIYRDFWVEIEEKENES